MVTHEHSGDPFQSPIEVLRDADGAAVEGSTLVHTWETGCRGTFRYAVVEVIDPASVQIDPLAHL